MYFICFGDSVKSGAREICGAYANNYVLSSRNRTSHPLINRRAFRSARIHHRYPSDPLAYVFFLTDRLVGQRVNCNFCKRGTRMLVWHQIRR